jgi:hypothetical protein
MIRDMLQPCVGDSKYMTGDGSSCRTVRALLVTLGPVLNMPPCVTTRLMRREAHGRATNYIDLPRPHSVMFRLDHYQ